MPRERSPLIEFDPWVGIPVLFLVVWSPFLVMYIRIRRIRAKGVREVAHWPTAEGAVRHSGITWWTPEFGHPVRHMRGGHRAEYADVRYTFEVDGKEYEGDHPSAADLSYRRVGWAHLAWDVVERLPVGTEVTVRYDPADPTRNCLDSGNGARSFT